MKTIIIQFLLLIAYVHGYTQGVCIDSSTHFSYHSLFADSFQVEKQIITKDGAKVFAALLYNNKVGRYKSIIGKISKNGQLLWCKKINFPYNPFGAMGLGALLESSNGNIFIASSTTQSDDKPFFYTVLSSGGSLIKSVKLGFNIAGLGDMYSRATLLGCLGVDSVVIGYSYYEAFVDNLTLITVDNNGNSSLSSAYTFKSPLLSTQLSYYNYLKYNNEKLFLFGSGDFYNYCSAGTSEQTKYFLLEIDWLKKTLIKKRAFCNPNFTSSFGYSNISIDDNTYDSRHAVFFQANGNIIFTRTAMGMNDVYGTTNRLFSISEFDSDFNHIKSEYITTGNQFKKNCFYEIFIDSSNNRHIRVHDRLNNQLFYAVGDKNNNYFLQKKIPFISNEEGVLFIRQPFVEPGYFTSFNVVSIYNGKSNIDNFRILAADTNEVCFGENIKFLSSQPADVTPINWQGDFVIKPAIPDAIPASITVDDYPFERNIVCNIVNKCDKINLTAPDTVCDTKLEVTIIAHKNAMCKSKVNFTFDTIQVSSWIQTNDTTLKLHFSKSYKGKIIANPSSCNLIKDTIDITVIEPVSKLDLGRDTLYCPDSSYKLNAFNPAFKNYLWQNNSTDSVILVSSPGKYFVTATDYCNRQYSDTLIIKDEKIVLHIKGDTLACKGEQLFLEATEGFINYLWNPFSEVKIITNNKVVVSPNFSIKYSVDAEIFKGCFVRDNVFIQVKDCPQSIYFPNSFTPNYDGLNDSFKPIVTGILDYYEFLIYNRWGQVIFRTSNPSVSWDGSFKNEVVAGLYTYICNYRFKNQINKKYKGIIVLIK